jgi:hypothetical protein
MQERGREKRGVKGIRASQLFDAFLPKALRESGRRGHKE